MQRRPFCSCWLVLALLIASPRILAEWEPVEIVGVSYPLLARWARITGLVVVRLSLEPDGSVKEAEPVSGHPLLAEAAKANAEKWKFRQSGPSRGQARDPYLVYRFVLKGSCAANDCRQGFIVELPNFVKVTSEIPAIQVSGGRVR